MIDLKIIIFGAGKRTAQILNEDKFSHDEILAISDNNPSKQGQFIQSKQKKIKIIPPSEITLYDFDIVLIAITDKKIQLNVIQQLIDLGIDSLVIRTMVKDSFIKVPVIDRTKNINFENVLAFMDTSCISISDHKTGIQRVLNSLYIEFTAMNANVYPVRFIGEYITSLLYKYRVEHTQFDNVEYPIKTKGGKILFPDTTWEIGSKTLKEASKLDFEIYSFIYDIILIRYRTAGERRIKAFTDWIEGVLLYSDHLLCISHTVANDIMDYYCSIGLHRSVPLSIHVIHMGRTPSIVGIDARDGIKKFVKESDVTFLMVGTVEPRKNHHLALEALQQYYFGDKSRNVKLLIMGKDGWLNDVFKELYISEGELKERVLWIQDASDEELGWAYSNCDALLFPSKAEGFGLPLVEAAMFNLPILCSDIPIFREIAEEHADYFTVDSVESLRNAIVRWIDTDKHPSSKLIRTYSWRECALEILNILAGESVPYKVLK